MPENFSEIPNIQKSEAEKPPEKKGDYSLFRDQCEAEKKKVNNLEDRIIERLKFLEKQTDPKIRQMIEDEIAELREKKSEARENATEAYNLHQGATKKLDDVISEKTH